MFNPSNISIEAEHHRRELQEYAKQQRLIREVKQASSRSSKNRLSLNGLLSTINPVEAESQPAPRVPLKSH